MKLFLIRGLPGSGKSSHFPKSGLVPIHSALIEADQYRYFNPENKYIFDPNHTADAHKWCQGEARRILSGKSKNLYVANTFCERWEMQPYIEMAKEFGAELEVVDLFDGGCTNLELASRNIHDVPLSTIAAMRDRYEIEWEIGNPLPPWERNAE